MNEIWKKNREKLLARMEMFSAAVLFAGKAPIKRGDENYPFSPDRNFYYVTGIEREDCILFLAKTRTGVEETLYIPRDNGVMAKWVGANMTAEEATAVSGIENIGWIDAFEEDFATYLFRSGIKKIWLDMENREWHGERTPALRFAEKDARAYTDEMKEPFGCKGGGKPDAVQGRVAAEKKALKNFFADKEFLIAE